VYCSASQKGLNRNQCENKVDFCKNDRPMRWTGPSCDNGGDGGCQCADYCAFTCKQA
jgi:hypothetical protein